jgi:serine/threonine-protein phosphatase 5
VRMEGYEVEHAGHCITVFSAPRYCDSTENKGAFINFGPSYEPEYVKFDAVPHPDVKPMVSTNFSQLPSVQQSANNPQAYANNGMSGMMGM